MTTKTPIGMMLDGVTWVATGGEPAPNPDGLPVATHTGFFMLGDTRVECARLSDGRAVVLEEGLCALLGVTPEELPEELRALKTRWST